MTIPADWMPPAKLSRVILHWTAGSHKATDFDRQHYHVLIEGDGRVVKGFPSIALNSEPKVKTGYAAHTRNCNTGSIGLSLCSMAGAIERPFQPGSHPLTKAQWEMGSTVAAEICKRYSIPVTAKTVLSHAEVQVNLGIAQRGKWDIAVLPFDRFFDTARECGDRFRAETAAKLARL
ncbi:peptidoglycan recognition family protein [Mesorhizobium sp. KR9-304]|uniref:peptidoglycan recognition protein family protein n=1 Tax=Mesorhizobium sp. KR9-304 TaxID=3156614 RepID=UPI0032B52068